MLLTTIFCLSFLLTILIECELFGWSTLLMLTTLGLFSYVNHTNLIPLIERHWVFFLEGIVAYVILGVAWSFVRWFLMLVSFRNKFKEAKAEYVLGLGLSKDANVPEQYLKEFKDHLHFKELVHGYSLAKKPKASASKAKIIAWMAFWPYSILGYILNDPIRRLFNTIFSFLKNSYQKMADRLLNDPELK